MSSKQVKIPAKKPAYPQKSGAADFDDLDRAIVDHSIRRARTESQEQVARLSARFAPKKPLR